VQISGEEYIQIDKVAKMFWANGKAEAPPKFFIVMGGVGAGKTTVRRQQFADDFVNFEFGEILNATKKEFGEDNPKVLDYAVIAGDMILRESLRAKKNMVIEIIGDNKALIEPVMDIMKNLGYNLSIQFVSCDPDEGYRRHLKLVEEDRDYLSSYFTQESTLSFFYRQLGLGEMPVSSQL
jgi:hypothetical protein